MKTEEAFKIMRNGLCPEGYMVHWERLEGRILTSDHFPDKHAGEALIPTEDEAWKMAASLAAKTRGKFVNFYVIDDKFAPVPGYRDRMIENI